MSNITWKQRPFESSRIVNSINLTPTWRFLSSIKKVLIRIAKAKKQAEKLERLRIRQLRKAEMAQMAQSRRRRQLSKFGSDYDFRFWLLWLTTSLTNFTWILWFREMTIEMRMSESSYLFELYNSNEMKRSKIIKSGIFGIKIKISKNWTGGSAQNLCPCSTMDIGSATHVPRS